MATMAVVGGPTKTHSGPNEKRGTGFCDLRKRSRHKSVRIKRGTRVTVLLGGRSKQDDGRNARLQRPLCLLHRLVDRELADSRYARNRMAHSYSRHDEERIDEPIARQTRFAHHAPPAIGLAQASRSLQGVSH